MIPVLEATLTLTSADFTDEISRPTETLHGAGIDGFDLANEFSRTIQENPEVLRDCDQSAECDGTRRGAIEDVDGVSSTGVGHGSDQASTLRPRGAAVNVTDATSNGDFDYLAEGDGDASMTAGDNGDIGYGGHATRPTTGNAGNGGGITQTRLALDPDASKGHDSPSIGSGPNPATASFGHAPSPFSLSHALDASENSLASSRNCNEHISIGPHGDGDSTQQFGYHDSANASTSADGATNDCFNLTQELARVMDGTVNDGTGELPNSVVLDRDEHLCPSGLGDAVHSNNHGGGVEAHQSHDLRLSRTDKRPAEPSAEQSNTKRARRQAIGLVVPPLRIATPAVIAQLEAHLPPPDPVHISHSDDEVNTATRQ